MSASNGSDTQGYLLVHFSREDTKQLLVLERQLVRDLSPHLRHLSEAHLCGVAGARSGA